MHFAAHRKGTSAFNHFTVNKGYTDIRLCLNAPGWTSITPVLITLVSLGGF